MMMSEINKKGAGFFAMAPFIASIHNDEQHTAALEFIE